MDGTLTHQSRAFEGERYPIIAFLHNATWSLTRPELKLLQNLGYPLNGDVTEALNAIGAPARSWVADSGYWNPWDGSQYVPQQPSARAPPRGISPRGPTTPPSSSDSPDSGDGTDSVDLQEGSSAASVTGGGRGNNPKRARYEWLACKPQGCCMTMSNIFTMLNVLEGRRTADRYIVEFCCSEDSALGIPMHESEGCVVLRFPYRLNLLKDAHIRLVRACLTLTQCLLWVSIPCTGGCPWNSVNRTKRGCGGGPDCASRFRDD